MIYLRATYPTADPGPRRQSLFVPVYERILGQYGHASPDLDYGHLDLVVCGKAFRDITGIKALPSDARIKRRDLIDRWQGWKGEKFTAGRGYPEWVWASTFEFLRTAAEANRGLRLNL